MFVNLCGHDVVIEFDNRTLRVVASGTVARCSSETVRLGTFDGVPLTETRYFNPVGVPEPKDGVMYIVSKIVKECYPNRDDVVFPNETKRNGTTVYSCQSLSPRSPHTTY